MIRVARAFCALSSVAQAQSVRLDGDEIGILLTGNTAVGVWDGANYRQFFGDDGVTIYAQKGSRSSRGEWRVEGDEYQSIWPNDAEWEGWFVMEYGGQWFWVSKTTPPTPFEVLEGQQLVAQ